MAHFVAGTNVSEAWLKSSQILLEARHSTIANLCIAIADPTTDIQAVRETLGSFRTQCVGEGRRHIPSKIATVAGTIFPNDLYRTTAEDPERHLYALERMIRPAIKRDPQNRRGTYFQRLVAYPESKQASGQLLNQLKAVLARLRRDKDRGYRNGNKYELAIFHPSRDNNLQGFPCLSHMSLTLSAGTLSATALYRNQYFVDRAYGNFIGLGNLLAFLSAESGFNCGELLSIASHARLEVGAFGKHRLTKLLSDCACAMKGLD